MRHPALAALVVLAFATAARAQPILFTEVPTRGPEIPVGPLAGDPEATSIALNPSNLGFLRAWNGVLLYTDRSASGPRGPGGGGLYLASPFPYLKSLVAGAAVEWVRPPDNFPYRDEGRLSLALAWRPLRMLALGAAYRHVFTGETLGVDRGIDTLDLSATARLGRYFALALVVRDVPSPQFQGLGIQRVYEPELVARPIGDDRLQLAASVAIGERRGDIAPAFRFVAMPTAGLVFRGALELRPDLFGDGSDQWDLRATLGVELDLARVGVAGYALFGGNASGARYDGFAVTVRVSGDRYPSLVRPRRFERIDLDDGSDRKRALTLAHLRRLERDRSAEGILVVMGDLGGSWASAEELRESFARLRTAGKHVYVYATELSTRSYYAALAAERIYLDPSGGLRLIGMSTTTLYFKGLLDKLGVDAEFVKIAEYKSAPEQLTRTGPSDEAQQVRAAILDDVYGRLVAAIAEARHLDPAQVRDFISLGPYTAGGALSARLVDELRHGDEVEDAIGALVGHHVDAAPPAAAPERPRSFAPPEIAVLFLDGDIVDGKSRHIPIIDRRLVGHETVIAALTAARDDPRVQAIVLRVDSPGGSALASDLIAREVERTRTVKPVVCSFGDIAASGGYFSAAACDLIYADPSTLTGSIGIFTGKADLSGLLGKLGINADTVRRGYHADMESLWRPYTPEEQAHLLRQLRYYYDRFVDTVARGRKLSAAEVDAVGRGHVWTGAQAVPIHLVDRLGGLMEAVAEAKRRAGWADHADLELHAIPEEPSSLIGQLLQFLGIDISGGEKALSAIPSLVEALRALPPSLLAAPSTPQARLPFDLRL